MIPTQRQHSVEGDLDAQVIKMGIDDNSLAHIMSVLTDLYSDPEMAVIREYSCNARDSHIEAGNNAPIEITLPTTFAHDFIIRDFGIGLSIDEISAIYSRYGASTKRGTDEQTGMLGLGCKSALTYAPSFMVTGYKHGVKTQCLVSRDEHGVGQMEVVDTCATDEPNGVEIRIPANARNSFRDKVNSFFQYWEPGTVLVNGEQPEFVKGTRIGESFIHIPYYSYRDGGDVLVMGGVPYPLNNGEISQSVAGRVIHFADIGAVNFTPSREELMLTPKTVAYIAETKALFERQVEQQMKDEFAACTSHHEAFLAAVRWRRVSSRWVMEYKGERIPANFTTGIGAKSFCYDREGWSRGNSQNGSCSETRNFSADELSESIIVTGTTVQAISTGMRARLRKWAEDNGFDEFRFGMFVQNSLGDPWVKPIAVVSYEDIKAVEMPKVARVSGGSGVSVQRAHPYDVVKADGTLEETSNIGANVVYASTVDFPTNGRYGGTGYRKGLGRLSEHLGIQIVLINRNRWDKFTRDYQHAQRLDDYMKAYYKNTLAAMTPEQRSRVDMPQDDLDLVDFLYPRANEIEDSTLRSAIKNAGCEDSVNVNANWATFRDLIREAGMTDSRPYGTPGMEHMTGIDVNDNRDRGVRGTLFRAYPMCYAMGTEHDRHHIAYINAAHKEGI